MNREITKSLIIVPTYPQHFHWTKKLLDSASSEEQIALGFSNKFDAENFSHSFQYKSIIIDDITSNNIGTFINNKKLNLIRKTQYDYDYIAVIDTEAVFLQLLTPHLDQIWEDNCFLANHSIDGARIAHKIIKLCGYNVDINDDLYIWLNCPPIYKTILLPDFFNWIDSRSHIIREDPEAFDFLLFAIYCRYELNMPWKVLEGHAWHGLVENGDEWSNDKNKHLIHQVVWSTYQEGIEKYPNIKMLFHLDRYPIK